MSLYAFILGVLAGFGIGVLFAVSFIPREVPVSDRTDKCLAVGGRYSFSVGDGWNYEYCTVDKEIEL